MWTINLTIPYHCLIYFIDKDEEFQSPKTQGVKRLTQPFQVNFHGKTATTLPEAVDAKKNLVKLHSAMEEEGL